MQGCGPWALVLMGLSTLLGGTARAQTSCDPDAAAELAASGSVVLTPLVFSSIADTVVPVWGTDGSVHLAYELQVANVSNAVARLDALEVVDPSDAGGRPLLGIDRVAAVDGTNVTDPNVLTDALVTRYRDLMLAPGTRDPMIARIEQVMLEDPEPLLRGIQAPTPLLWGKKDAMIPITNAADYLRNLPHATLVAMPGLGHVPQEEAPAVSLAPVQAFLAR